MGISLRFFVSANPSYLGAYAFDYFDHEHEERSRGVGVRLWRLGVSLSFEVEDAS